MSRRTDINTALATLFANGKMSKAKHLASMGLVLDYIDGLGSGGSTPATPGTFSDLQVDTANKVLSWQPAANSTVADYSVEFLLEATADPTSSTPAAPSVAFNTTTRILTAAHSLGTAEIEYSTAGSVYQPYSPLQVDNAAYVESNWLFRTKAASGRNPSPAAGSPAIALKEVTDGYTPPVNTLGFWEADYGVTKEANSRVTALAGKYGTTLNLVGDPGGNGAMGPIFTAGLFGAKPGLDWANDVNNLTYTFAQPLAGDFYTAIVAKFSAAEAFDATLWTLSFPTTEATLYARLNGGNSGSMYALGGYAYNLPVPAADTAFLLEVERIGAAQKIWLNGNFIGQYGAPENQIYGVSIGGNRLISSNMAGAIGAFVLATGAVTAAEKTALRTHFAPYLTA